MFNGVSTCEVGIVSPVFVNGHNKEPFITCCGKHYSIVGFSYYRFSKLKCCESEDLEPQLSQVGNYLEADEAFSQKPLSSTCDSWLRNSCSNCDPPIRISGGMHACLDKEGKLLEEPYPVTIDPTTNVKVVLEEDSITKGRINVVATLDKPIKPNVKAVVLCKVPKDFEKIEIIKLGNEFFKT